MRILIIIALVILLIGCKPVIEDPTEETLLGSRIAAVLRPSMAMESGEDKANSLMIRNAYADTRTFKIEYCKGCYGPSSSEISGKGFDTIEFKFEANELGEFEKVIKIQDDADNVYSLVRFNVTVK